MIDSTADLAFVTHILCCSCAMCFSAAASSENDHGSMNLASNTAAGLLDHAVEGRRHPALDRMKHLPLHVVDDLAGVALVPVPVEVLGHGAELDDQVAGEVFRLDLAALLPPQPDQGGFVIAHDDPGIRAADKGTTINNPQHAYLRVTNLRQLAGQFCRVGQEDLRS